MIEAAENVEDIKFDTGLYPIGPEHFCEIIKEILSKPNIKKITYEVQFDDDTNFEDFPVNLTIKKHDLSYFILLIRIYMQFYIMDLEKNL